MKYTQHGTMICFLVFLSSITFACSAHTLTGHWIDDTSTPIRTDHQIIHFFTKEHHYVNGGLTFTYPAGYFSSAPCVFVTIELNGIDYSQSLYVQPIVTSNSPTQVTVRVNKEREGFFINTTDEAEDDEVIVHLFAFGP